MSSTSKPKPPSDQRGRWLAWTTLTLIALSLGRFGLALVGVGGDWAFRHGLLGIGTLAMAAAIASLAWLVRSRCGWRRKLLASVLFYPVVGLLVTVFPPLWFLTLVDTCTSATFRFTVDDKVIALTIDDAVDPNTTPQILDLLDEYSIRATFFTMTDTLGDDEPSQVLLQRIAARHELGNHQTRDRPAWKMSRDNFADDVQQAQERLEAFAPVEWLRPGSGLFTPGMVRAADEQNLKLLLGSVFSWDSHHTSVQFSTRFVTGRCHPGAVIVLHDGDQRGERTLEVLRQAIPLLQQQGYRFVTVSELASLAEQP